LVANAEAEVNQRREADEQTDENVQTLQGDDGEKAEQAMVWDGVAEETLQKDNHSGKAEG
jgi:hypothetical protein